jgi:exo-1,4-beta-D-glucosaminidase
MAKAQAMAYDGERAMFEAYGRNKYASTGVIQWMLNNGWPSNMWHLYDYYLQPAGGYFGTKKACEPLHIQFSYDDRSVVVVNSVNRPFPGLTAEASMYDFDLRRLFFRQTRLDSAADSVQRLFIIPADRVPAGVHFVALRLTDPGGRVVSTNFYGLPKTLSTFDWAVEHQKDHPYYTAVTSYEDLSQLSQLLKVRLDAAASFVRRGKSDDVRVQIKNPSRELAFQIRLALVDGKTGDEILPVLWEDNYLSLLPGESRTLVAHYDSPVRTQALKLEVHGWNIEGTTAPVASAGAGGGGVEEGWKRWRPRSMARMKASPGAAGRNPNQ